MKSLLRKGEGTTKAESSYFCEACQETSPGTKEEHLEGRRHLKTQERLEKYGSLEKIAEVFKTSYCFICGVKSNSLEQFEIHVKGNKHKNRCKTFDLDPSLTNFPPGMKIPPGVKLPPGYDPSLAPRNPTNPAPKGPPRPKTLLAAAAPAAKKNAYS
uniref:C2H2-type domain-containing protein n=1 Tax=Ixodes ricinus TaxID=34613 RepID=A0A0K8RHB1_IXORI